MRVCLPAAARVERAIPPPPNNVVVQRKREWFPLAREGAVCVGWRGGLPQHPSTTGAEGGIHHLACPVGRRASAVQGSAVQRYVHPQRVAGVDAAPCTAWV